jgi:hypothetical protein
LSAAQPTYNKHLQSILNRQSQMNQMNLKPIETESKAEKKAPEKQVEPVKTRNLARQNKDKQSQEKIR